MIISNRKSRIIFYALALLIAFSICFSLYPLQVNATAVTDVYIEDQAEIFTSEEEEALTKEMKKLQDKYDMDFVILATNVNNYTTAKEEIEDYHSLHNLTGSMSEDAVISLIDMSDRWYEIRSFGKAETYITDKRVEMMQDKMDSDMHSNRYYDAYQTYFDYVDTYLGRHPNPLTWTWVQILIGFAIGGIITASMVYHSKGKITTHFRTYLDKENSGLVAKRDIFIRTTVSRVKMQSSSGGGHSRGGRSSSGGGRHF